MHIKHILILSFSCLLLACVGSDEKPKGEPTGEVSSRSDCISTGSIRDYTVLDDANLIVTERASRKYHVALSRRAYGLRSSPTIGFQADSSRICGHFDDLVIDGGFGPEKFRIALVTRLTPETEEELLIRFGLKEPENVQPRVPEKVEGAEVEELD